MALKKISQILVPSDDYENSERTLEEAIVLAKLSSEIITGINGIKLRLYNVRN